MKLIVRNTHKYLSFFISIQLLLWTVSGIYFAFNKIENIRGEQYRLQSPFKYSFKNIEFEIPEATSAVLKTHLQECIKESFNGNGDSDNKIEEIVKLLKR